MEKGKMEKLMFDNINIIITIRFEITSWPLAE